MKRLLRAGWIATMQGPRLRDGGIVYSPPAAGDSPLPLGEGQGEGLILEVGEGRALQSRHPDAIVEDRGDCVILPGLINPHTHLELSLCTAGESCPMTFEQWLLGVRKWEFAADAAAQEGVRQCLRFGVTAVGDISQQSHLTRPVLRRSPLRCVSFGETLGLGALRGRFEKLLERAMGSAPSPGAPGERIGRLRIGLSPHAPYTVDLDGYRRCVALAREHNLPLATHLAESPHERRFLEEHAGPFRELWDRIGSWAEPVPTFAGSPIQMARAIGLLDLLAVLAHVNYCDDPDLDLLAAGRASVVFCPRTHRYFGHPPHRWREMLGRGINVAVGTDSCASSPDLNPVEELRLLHRQAPEVPAERLWELITTRAAAALAGGTGRGTPRPVRWDPSKTQVCEDADLWHPNQIGAIVPGRSADLVAFPVSSDDPLTELLENDGLPQSVWIGGAPVP